MQVSIACEGWFGLDWPQWRRLVDAVERLGFAGLYLSDHILLGAMPPRPSLELSVALTYLADHSARVRFGALVAPLSVRDPVTLARQAAALDALSGGRFVLGVGAGWNAGEHAMFGYALGDVPTRFARLEEGLEVLTRLLRGDGPASYAGRFFQLRDAVLTPQSASPGRPPLLIGGHGPRRTLPLVARYADIWNANTKNLSAVCERAALLDRLLVAAGRRPSDVRRTMNTPVFCGRTPAELERRLRGIRREPGFEAMPLDALVAALRARQGAIIGTPEEVVAQLRACAAAGIAEVSVPWFDADDLEGLEHLATAVLRTWIPRLPDRVVLGRVAVAARGIRAGDAARRLAAVRETRPPVSCVGRSGARRARQWSRTRGRGLRLRVACAEVTANREAY
jgi:alkanesulfonate monooxygenase SsuD/methylene tetrahydromethanopterin reductase-like flavin-dependent oxidoreductase (luciferase family)